eukprot:CCRYP_009005-RD/>CCRYP_009005-RD protein AED:0.36 eAED:0.36 QI:20/0.12/0.11/1/0/0/9/0/1019
MAKRRTLLIPPLQHAVDFVQDFLLNFLLPLLVILFAALSVTVLCLRLRQAIFGRYATPTELLDEAITLLKKSGNVGSGVVVTNENIKAKRSCPEASTNNKLGQFFLTSNPSSDSRQRALDNLRLVIQLDPNMIQAYVVLANELFYGEINYDSKIEYRNRAEKNSVQHTTTNSSVRQRQGVDRTVALSKRDGPGGGLINIILEEETSVVSNVHNGRDGGKAQGYIRRAEEEETRLQEAVSSSNARIQGTTQRKNSSGGQARTRGIQEVKKKLADPRARRNAVENLEVPNLHEPEDPAAGASPVELKKWEADYDEYRKNKKAWEDAKPRLYQLILAHCHPDMEQKVQASERFETINQEQDPVGLLQLIRSIAHKHEDVKGGTMSIVEHDMGLYTCYQRPYWTNIEYYNLFKAARDVVNVHGGQAGFNKGLYEKALGVLKSEAGLGENDDASDEMRQQALKDSCNEYLGCLFIRNADDARYKGLKYTLDNANLFGNDDYPKSIEDALRQLNNHKSTGVSNWRRRDGMVVQDAAGVAFGQTGERQRDKSNDKCYHCLEKGHHAKECPKREADERQEGADFFNVEEEAQEIEEELERMGIAHGADFFNAEFQSNDIDIIDGVGFHISDRMTCDRTKLYLDTCATNHTMFATERLEKIHKVGVKLRQHCNAGATTTGRMGYWKGIKFWVNESGIANLLSVPQLEKDGYELEYSTASGWLVHTPAGNTIHFSMDIGMCGGMPFIDLAADPTTYLSRRDGVAMIQTVRKNFEGYTRRQVKAAKQARDMQAMMAHPSDSAMKHMTVRQRPTVVRPEYVDIPAALFERIRNVTLAADVMFVNGLPFFVTLSRDIKLITIEFLPSRTIPMLCATLKKTLAIYKRGGFTERARSVTSELPYKNEPGAVQISMIKHLKKVFDDFPDEVGKPASTPASDHLFQVRDPEEVERLGKFLPEEQATHFHHTVAQLLFISSRVRRDIQTAVSFLTTRVKRPDEDDWGKLKRVLRYLKGTMHMKLKLSVENIGMIRWC